MTLSESHMTVVSFRQGQGDNEPTVSLMARCIKSSRRHWTITQLSAHCGRHGSQVNLLFT